MSSKQGLLTGMTTVLAACGIALGACGDDDGGDETTANTNVSAADVRQCFEGIGQKVREIEVSFAKLPPDLDVSSTQGSANVWVADDASGTDAVIAQEEEFAKLDTADAITPVEDKVVRSGNVIAVVSEDSSPDYRATLEECIPPSA